MHCVVSLCSKILTAGVCSVMWFITPASHYVANNWPSDPDWLTLEQPRSWPSESGVWRRCVCQHSFVWHHGSWLITRMHKHGRRPTTGFSVVGYTEGGLIMTQWKYQLLELVNIQLTDFRGHQWSQMCVSDLLWGKWCPYLKKQESFMAGLYLWTYVLKGKCTIHTVNS